jgi:hypothetical protein
MEGKKKKSKKHGAYQNASFIDEEWFQGLYV